MIDMPATRQTGPAFWGGGRSAPLGRANLTGGGPRYRSYNGSYKSVEKARNYCRFPRLCICGATKAGRIDKSEVVGGAGCASHRPFGRVKRGATFNTMHPSLSYLGATDAHSFPLVLVVGRAPNCDQSIGPHAGTYEFVRGEIPPFWSLSYGFAGMHLKTRPMSALQLREACVQSSRSPIIYADACPAGVPNGMNLRKAIRRFDQKQIGSHVQTVFTHSDFIARTRLVILSGLRRLDPLFDLAADTYAAECRQRGIACVELPFFYGNNMPTLMQQWSSMDEARATLADVMGAFEHPSGN